MSNSRRTDVATFSTGRTIAWSCRRRRMLRTVIGTDGIGDGPRPEPATSGEAGVPGTRSIESSDGSAVRHRRYVFLAAWHNHKVRRYDVATGLRRCPAGAVPGSAATAVPPTRTPHDEHAEGDRAAPSGDLYSPTPAISASFGSRPTRGPSAPSRDGAARRRRRWRSPMGAVLVSKGPDQPDGDGGDNPSRGALALDAQGGCTWPTRNQRIRRTISPAI